MPTSTAEIDQLIDELVAKFPPATTDPVAFLGEQFDRGLAWVTFPKGEGGLGGSPTDQLYALRRISKLGAPSALGRNVIGYGMVAPTIVAHGTDWQRGRFLRPLFTGEEIWCQLFSEPGAGSDVAALAMRRSA
jgi:alkylation response protein AidB-like acyl-CoA dehydrogenase